MMFEEACFHLFVNFLSFNWGRGRVSPAWSGFKSEDCADKLCSNTQLPFASFLCWGAPSPLTSMIVWDTYKIKKKIYIYGLLTWMNLFVECFFMQCWGQCLFLYWLVEIPSSISWNRCHACKAVWFQSGFEHFTSTGTHPDTFLRD